MSLAYIQEQLQDIYELDIPHRVSDFLITQKEQADQFGASISSKNTREKLLVCQDDNELLLSLYLHRGVVNNLTTEEANLKIDTNNLEDFCLALEGISHFLYLIWNASFDRSVTMLEMELQAEIDKFIMLGLQLQQQNHRLLPGQIRELLFESISYHDHLSRNELQRYRDANNFAEKYCWYLESHAYLQGGAQQELYRELRRFYRLNLAEKLRRINTLH